MFIIKMIEKLFGYWVLGVELMPLTNSGGEICDSSKSP